MEKALHAATEVLEKALCAAQRRGHWVQLHSERAELSATMSEEMQAIVSVVAT